MEINERFFARPNHVEISNVVISLLCLAEHFQPAIPLRVVSCRKRESLIPVFIILKINANNYLVLGFPIQSIVGSGPCIHPCRWRGQTRE
jgi:hypothetical protein